MTWPPTGHAVHAAADSSTDDGVTASLRTDLHRRVLPSRLAAVGGLRTPDRSPLLCVSSFVDEGAPLRVG